VLSDLKPKGRSFQEIGPSTLKVQRSISSPYAFISLYCLTTGEGNSRYRSDPGGEEVGPDKTCCPKGGATIAVTEAGDSDEGIPAGFTKDQRATNVTAANSRVVISSCADCGVNDGTVVVVQGTKEVCGDGHVQPVQGWGNRAALGGKSESADEGILSGVEVAL